MKTELCQEVENSMNVENRAEFQSSKVLKEYGYIVPKQPNHFSAQIDVNQYFDGLRRVNSSGPAEKVRGRASNKCRAPVILQRRAVIFQ